MQDQETPARTGGSSGGRPRSQPSAVRSAIRFWREQRELTQVALAEAAGVRQDQLSRYENGVALPTLGECEALAKALEVTLADLYSDELLRAMRGAEEVA